MFKLHNIFFLVVCLLSCCGTKVINSTGQNTSSSSRNNCISCKDKWTCDSDSNKSFPDKGCYCDKLCGVMNDCCSNFNTDDSELADKFNESMFECRSFFELTNNYNYGVYVVANCPAKWKDEEIRQLCEGNEMDLYFINQIRNSSWIISSSDVELYDLLSVTVIEQLTGVIYKNPFCAYCHGDIDDALEWQTQIYDEIKHSEGKKPYPMHELIDGKMGLLVNNYTHRECWLRVDKAYCPDAKKKDDCSNGEFAVVYDSAGNLYKNIQCAICYGISCNELRCDSSESGTVTVSMALPALVNINSEEIVNVSSNKTTAKKLQGKHVYDYITIVCLIISVSSLVLTILTFLMFGRLRARSGKIKLCLMISLLLAQLFFLALDSAKTGNTLTCKSFAVVTHYFLLVTFCWMNVLALDICKTVSKQRAVQITVTKRTMFHYCLFALGAPCLVVTIPLLLDLFSVDTSFNPRYGALDQCWLSTRDSILLFFLVPLALCKIFDLVVFIITGVHILRTKKRASKYGQRHGRSTCSILIFIKLSLIMGLSWIIAFIANVADNDFVWILFILFNSLQGLFIFLCFCCNRTVLYLWISECSYLKSQLRSSDLRLSDSSSTQIPVRKVVRLR